MSEICATFGPGVTPSMALEQDAQLCREIRMLRHFVSVFHKQGQASEYSGGKGNLTDEEEKYLTAIQDAIDARNQ